jgi:predicted ATPase
MKIRYIRAQNFKQLQDVELKDIKNLSLLVGANGSGKSSLLELLNLFWRTLNMENQGLGYGRTTSELTYLRSNRNPIKISVIIEYSEEELGFGMKDGKSNISINKSFTPVGDGLQIGLSDVQLGDTQIREKGQFNQTQLNDGSILSVGQLTSIWGKIKSSSSRFRFVPAFRNQPTPSDHYFGRQASPMPDFYSKLSAKHRNYDDVTLWESQQAEMSRMFPEKRIDESGGEVSIINPGPDNRRIVISSSQEGGGIQEVMQVLDYITGGEEIIAIDEPELHLHVDLERKLLARISELTKDKQFLLSTHSPFILDAAKAGSIHLFSSTRMTTSARPVEVGDAWDIFTSLGLKPHDVLLYDTILFVEGETELAVLPNWARTAGIDLSSVNLLPMEGVTNTGYNVRPWITTTKRIPFVKVNVVVDANGREQVRRVIEEGLLASNEAIALSKKDIEEFYPIELVAAGMKDMFGVEVSPDDLSARTQDEDMVSELIGALRRTNQTELRHWKRILGEYVSVRMTDHQIPPEVKTFLRNVSE